MVTWKRVVGACGLAVWGLMIPQRAVADEWNEKTILTFRAPVELPGVTLPAGTYVFKLADPGGDRHIVRVFDKNESRLYATLMTIPDQRMTATGKPVITFEERVADAPEAVKAWFYPGHTIGEEFVYPKLRATQLAKANRTSVLSMPDEMAANIVEPATSATAPHVMAMKQAPVKRVTPTGEELDVVTVQAGQTHAPTLPRTASSLPTLALIGAGALLASAGLRWWRTRLA